MGTNESDTVPPARRRHHVPAPAVRPGVLWLRSLLLAVAVGALVSSVMRGRADPQLRLLSAWNGGLLTLLIASWIPLLRSTPAFARARAADPGGFGILTVAVVASIACLLGTIVALTDPNPIGSFVLTRIEVAQALLAVVGGWLLMHTAFALHYARLYYGGPEPGGLVFPGEAPDDVDFAYFAFGIGMAFQVSDVTTTSRAMRRSVLLHAVLAFASSSAILALTINRLAGRV